MMGKRTSTSGPLTMAQQQCANYMTLEHPPSSGCILPPKDIDEGDCALRVKGRRCGHFEKAVLPLAERMPRYADVPPVYYGRAAKQAGLSNAAIPDFAIRRCQCGNPLEPRKRFCSDCSKTRLREARRRALAKHREKEGGLK